MKSVTKMVSAFLIMFFVSMSISGQNVISPGNQTQKQTHQKMKEDITKGKENIQEVAKLVSELFRLIDKALEISETRSKMIKERYGKGENFNADELNELTGDLQKIHNTFKQILDKRNYYEKLLKDYNGNFDELVERASDLVKEYDLKIKEQSKVVGNLESIKERTPLQEQDLKNEKVNLGLLNDISNVVNDYKKTMEGLNSNYETSEETIDLFLNQIGHSTKTSDLMIEYVKAYQEKEDAKKSREDMGKISEYTNQMYEILKDLAKSLEHMQKTANPIP